MKTVILGCGDVGQRIANALLSDGIDPAQIIAYVNSPSSADACAALGLTSYVIDLDQPETLNNTLHECHASELYYTVAPQKSGEHDLRSRALLEAFNQQSITPNKVVLISTTGVYGDCAGEWVSEQNALNPSTERAKRRVDSERQWGGVGSVVESAIGDAVVGSAVVLRVPGIYAFSRLPRARIAQRTPVVNPQECGYTNRIHADDLARICIIAMRKAPAGEVFNATDGRAGNISEYLQAAAQYLGEPPLPEISLQDAAAIFSASMLSYLHESRRISNQKMLDELGVVLQYPDFREGIKH